MLVVIGELFSLTLNVGAPQPALVLSPWLYEEANQVFYSNRDPTRNWTDKYISNMLNGSGMGVRCLTEEPLDG